MNKWVYWNIGNNLYYQSLPTKLLLEMSFFSYYYEWSMLFLLIIILTWITYNYFKMKSLVLLSIYNKQRVRKWRLFVWMLRLFMMLSLSIFNFMSSACPTFQVFLYFRSFCLSYWLKGHACWYVRTFRCAGIHSLWIIFRIHIQNSYFCLKKILPNGWTATL